NNRKKFLDDLIENQAKLQEEIEGIEKTMKTFLKYDSINQLTEAAQMAKTLEATFQDCKDKAKLYNIRESHFNKGPTDYSKVGEMYKEFEPFYQVWTNTDTFLNKAKSYLTEDFANLKGEEVKNMNDTVLKNLASSNKKLRDRPGDWKKIIEMSDEIKKRAEEFKPIANLAVFLTTKGLTERHWTELKQLTEIDCINREGLTLQSIVSVHNITPETLSNASNI
ncbi:MAG: hypothetical protein GW827_10105, partial [Flavobacteriales bacterium]|nr:hypothetical protein [Flavobacteriales bacterium]